MAESALQKLEQLRKGNTKLSISDANKWYRRVIKDSASKDKIGGATKKIIPGTMLMYTYDAKYKDKLDYWDKQPLIMVVDVGADYFYGINFHYLPAGHRLALLEALMSNTKGKDALTRVKISYDILKQASKFKYYKACFKKYLKKQLKSRTILIPSDDWMYTVLLPTQKFVGKSRQAIYKQSIKIGKG